MPAPYREAVTGDFGLIRLASTSLHALEEFLEGCGAEVARLLLRFGSTYSLIELGCTLGIAALFTLVRRRTRRAVPFRALLRALLPRRLWRSASGRADLGFTLFNIFLAMLLFGWALVTYRQVSLWTAGALGHALGSTPGISLPPLAVAAVTTAALFLAYELAYWVDHFLSHKLPFLWQFHVVHHSAESLSLATNFRVHPVDSIVFYNFIALFTGVTGGLLGFLFGPDAAALEIGGSNVLFLVATVLLTHLHHSHFWISFSGRWGLILLSPAHHQIHHSADPAHYDRNFGNSLAIFDRLFGTLHVPAAKRERLTLGVPEFEHDPHSIKGGFLMPFVTGAAMIGDGALVLPRRLLRTPRRWRAGPA